MVETSSPRAGRTKEGQVAYLANLKKEMDQINLLEISSSLNESVLSVSLDSERIVKFEEEKNAEINEDPLVNEQPVET